jgi:hypothetical protein
MCRWWRRCWPGTDPEATHLQAKGTNEAAHSGGGLSAWWRGEGFYFDEAITEPPLGSQLIGRIRLKSRFIASAFGDQLPFRHPTLQEPAIP